MKVKGLKHLNSNLYDKIIIRRLLEELQIDIKCKSKYNTIKTKTKFYDEIKSLTDKEKITKIIEYFLRNNKIQLLKDGEYLTHYSGKFTVIGGPRELLLQIKKEDIDNDLIALIKEKYIKDRMDFLIEHNNTNIICLSDNVCESSYKMIEESFYRKVPYINIYLKQSKGKLEDFEYDFFMKFIEEKINNSEKIVCGAYNYQSRSNNELSFLQPGEVYLRCSECIICISSALYRRIQLLIYDHNKLFEETKKLQLSFDGNNS